MSIRPNFINQGKEVTAHAALYQLCPNRYSHRQPLLSLFLSPLSLSLPTLSPLSLSPSLSLSLLPAVAAAILSGFSRMETESGEAGRLTYRVAK